MAVKKHKLVADNHNQLGLVALAEYFKLINEQTNYLPPPQELVKHCHDILKCLSRTAGSEEQLWQLLQPVEEFLVRITFLQSDVRHEIFIAILDKFYSYISDPQSDACPATATVLVVIDNLDEETVLSAARWLVQQKENEPGGAGLRSALSCLYCWLFEWHGTPALGRWVIAYIRALEEKERFDILIETTLDNVENLFTALGNPVPLRQSTADAIFHVLASMRESSEAFDKISSHVSHVLMNLVADSGQWSRQILQNLVDILTAMVDQIQINLNSDAQEEFREKYAEVSQCLERHISARAVKFLHRKPWRIKNSTSEVERMSTNEDVHKVGLINLGNTCYMNSVLQALLYARHFSSYAILKMYKKAYWSEISVLFVKMMYSEEMTLDPSVVCKLFKPSHFMGDHQHDSSEFLVYVFQLLRTYEEAFSGDVEVEKNASIQPNHSEENAGTSRNRHSTSPTPDVSGSSDFSIGLKRPAQEEAIGAPSPKRRSRPCQNNVWRLESFIVDTFGGSVVTRVECFDCHSYSLSRDYFLDLTLSFPEKTKGKRFSIQSLIDYYCSNERLSGENKYQCLECGGLRDADRSVLIEKTPVYLILTLKNFKFDPKLIKHTKLMQSIYYDQTIDVPTVRAQANLSTYTLFATVIHSGTTIDSGHYYTLAKDNDRWYKYDDEEVTVHGESCFSSLRRSCTPYILFYRRNDIEETPMPTINELPQTLQNIILAHNKKIVTN